jgi:hypothetical protein
MRQTCKALLRGQSLLGLSFLVPCALADNSLGQRDNLSSDVNARQKAEMQIPAGFTQGTTFKGLLRNYYLGRDNHNTPDGRDQREWVQGVYLSLRSGYTDTPIGVGVDVHGFYGLRLDGGGGSGGAGLLPLDSQGKPQNEFSAAGAALKLRAFDSLLMAGDQLVENPIAAGGVSRVFPQTLRGVTLRNYSITNLTLDAGWLDSTRLRNQSGHSHLFTSYGNSNHAGIRADRESPHIAWLGGVYSAPQAYNLSVYSGQLEDVWRQDYVGFNWPVQISQSWRMTPFIHYYRTRDQGASQLGQIENQTYSGGLLFAGDGHSLSLGVQKVDGDTPFDYIAQDDRSFLYLSNSMQYADFNAPTELSWKLQYAANLGFINAPNLQLSTSYSRGEADLTKANPNSVGYGYIYNADGKHAKHWERDIALRYAVPAGQAKGLNVTLRWAAHRAGQGYTAPGNTRGNASADEYRVIVDYPFAIF